MMNEDEQFALKDKVAIVTGGTDGIGLGIARQLARSGAKVVVAARRAERCATAADELTATGAAAMGIPTDVTDEAAVAALIDATVQGFGGIDILVNCAGGSFSDRFKRAPLVELEATDLIESYRLNVVSAFLCSTAALPHLRSREGASIVNVSSVGSEPSGAPGIFAAYGAAKAALNHLSHSMASAFAPEVRVNVVLPGLIDTPRTTANRTPERLEASLKNLALGRIGTPEDVAMVVAFLASPLASWITGSLFRLDGGAGIVPTPLR